MRVVTGYVNGRAQWSDNEPAFARVQGFGGSALGHFSQTVLTVGPSFATRRAAQLKRKAAVARAGRARRAAL
jgi:hypothetical protein